ncbi:SDR family NAD(P)-dependent oxidoreductase [Variovorax paradoxus]|uniref:SDR family NAD(P)-dependent oxidoreductase n=1 Tax=Variovorax paradoxus TaxID=34073 RepID=UPI001932FA4A|nr:SDR family oxidoreductase [Variovorax paradoxus]
MSTPDFQGGKARTAVVTGASSGIGFAIARRLLAEGWNVVGNARSDARLVEAARQFGAGDRFAGVAGDIADPRIAAALVEHAVTRFGGVDALVNNAGIFLAKPFVDFTPAEVEQQIATNVKGTIYASQAAARHMTGRGAGAIVNITASVALQPRSNVPAFMAVLLKGGLNAATRALALELAPHGVRVNAVAPGIIDSPMHAPETHGFLKTLQPAGRLGTVDEIADAVLYLVNAGFTSGAVLPVDGAGSAGNYIV